MSENSGKGRTWLAYGCMGCAGILGVIVIVVGSMAGLAALRARSEEVVDKTLTHETPLPTRAEAPRDPASDEATGRIDLPAQDGPTQSVGRLVLDLTGAEFTVEPASAGEPLSVEASFDEKSFELTERTETPEGQPWRYELRFRRQRGMLITGLTQLFGGTKPKVKVHIPPDVPLELELSLDQGALQAELGGLWLTEADLSVDKGAMIVEIDSPLREPMRRLAMNGSMSAVISAGLGNASPARLDIDCSMGGLVLDMRGNWRQDSEITVRVRQSGGEIQLPEDMPVEGLDTFDLGTMRKSETPRPTLRFSPDSRLEDVVIER